MMQLQIQGLSKTYSNGVKALDHVDLEINKGMFGLLGPNGAGKSSLMRTIATLQTPDQGQLQFNGLNILQQQMDFRKVLGYLPQSFGVYPNTSAVELLDYFARLKGITSKKERQSRVQEVLELTHLYADRKKYVSNYSGGMKQRFGIAQLLLSRPQLLIVDEPTSGLDPAERNRFLNIIRGIASDNIVIFSTHIVEDVKDLCQELAIMNQGRILGKVKPYSAIQKLADYVWTKVIAPSELEHYQAHYQVLSTGYNEQHQVKLRLYSKRELPPEFEKTAPNLEDVYFYHLYGFGSVN